MDSKENNDHSIYATVTIKEKLEPFARYDQYEDPMEEFLENNPGIASIDGGGTLMGKDGTIECIDIAFVLIDKENGVQKIINQLEKLGVPKGTTIQVDGEEPITFGVNDGIEIFFPREDLDKATDESCNINNIFDQINHELGENGRITSWSQTKTGTSLYAFGPSANKMKESIKNFLQTNPMGRLATVSTYIE